MSAALLHTISSLHQLLEHPAFTGFAHLAVAGEQDGIASPALFWTGGR